MRIVIDMQGSQTGSRFRGIGRCTLSLAKAIARHRGSHEIILALSSLLPEAIDSISDAFVGLLPKENIRVWHALPNSSWGIDAASQRRCIAAEKMREAFLADQHPDVVLIASLFDDDGICSIGSFTSDLPTVVILHDLIPLINPDESYLANKPQWYFRRVASLQRSALLLAVSESARQEAVTALHFDSDSLVVISEGSSDCFHVSEQAKENKESVWRKLGISKPFVMYSGGSDERKNLSRLIEAYAQLPKKTRAAHQLVFAGKMEEYRLKEYRLTAKKSKLSPDELIFTGYIEDSEILTLYNTCALFVFPSLHEGFGLPPLEAMACGAPVIGSCATSLPEVIGLKEALFDPTSVRAIRNKMLEALTNEAFRARLLTHGQTHHRRFSWDESAQRALRALERFDPCRSVPVSPKLIVERPTIFTARNLKILAIKLDHLGDFILSIPALAKLRARYPDADIDIIVGSWNAAAAEKLKLFDKVYTYDFFKRKSTDTPSIKAHELEALLATLDTYDIAIDFRRCYETRFLLAKINARFKVGYQTRDAEINGSLDILIPHPKDEPAFKATWLNRTPISRQMIALVDALPDNANDFIALPRLSSEKMCEPWTIGIFPKAGNNAREWGEDNFKALIEMLQTHSRIQRIDVYFSNKAGLVKFNLESTSKLKFHIDLPFSELAETLSRNEICVANNSGGGHLASYLGVTTIGVYSGHEMQAEWAPPFNDSYVIHLGTQCSPCHGGKKSDCPYDLFCLTEIAVNDVYTAVIGALEKGKSPADGSRMKNMPKLALQQNTDAIVGNLIHSIANTVRNFEEKDKMAISEAISENHPAYIKAFGLFVSHQSVRRQILDMPDATLRFRGDDKILRTTIGKREEGSIWSTGQEGHLIFGPYIPLDQGLYQIRIYGALASGGAFVDIAVDKSCRVLEKRELHPSASDAILASFPITLNTPCADLEIRVMVSAQTDLRISMIEIALLE